MLNQVTKTHIKADQRKQWENTDGNRTASPSAMERY